MKKITPFLASLLLIFSFVFNALPCGPSYISAVFDQTRAPENPFENFAAGKIGIVKPTYNRTVLFAAYRFLNGGGFTAEEQKGLVEVWKADFNNKSFEPNGADEAIKKWVEKRKSVVEKEEKLPEIYAEREYGGYDFFPNCTESAFETAAETLSNRIVSYGSDNKDVKNWVSAQDKVFMNCSSGKQMPDEADASMPEWLQKDRAYQIAAAEFYSLDYVNAKQKFAEIALDAASPWQETADYLVARTIIRQASLSKSDEKAKEYYAEAEQKLQNLSSNKFGDSAERLLGLVKFRLHPEDRVRELAQKLTNQSGNQNLRQDLIDYSWLLDKFEKETLEREEKRKEAEKPKDSNSNSTEVAVNMTMTNTSNSADEKKNEGDLSLYLYEDSGQSWNFFVKPDATDDEAIAEAERVIGKPLTEAMKKSVRDARQYAYQNRFSSGRREDYPGRYYGSEQTSLSTLPDFLRYDELNDWLFTYQIPNNESYLYALSKYRQTNTDLWLMTALSKADKNSSDLPRLLESAGQVSRTSLAFPTVAYHTARLYIEQGKSAEAKKLLDEVLGATDDLPVSTINQFMDLRLKLAETMEDFLKYSLRKPFGFNMDGSTGSIEDFIAEQKQWYNPKYDEKPRDEYEREVEERFADELKWQNRLMFDSPVLELFNKHFPLSVLLEVEKSPALPDYLREQFVLTIWSKSLILEDYAVAQKIAPELIKFRPEMETSVNQILTAKTPAQKQTAALFHILKNPILSPFIEDVFTKTDNETGQFDSNDWWCAPYDAEDGEISSGSLPKPKFLTEAQSKSAQAERAKIKDLGDAPTFLGKKVLEWAKRTPNDKRIPESLYIVYDANGWRKFNCGNNEELRQEIAGVLQNRYPQSEWTQKIGKEEEQ